MCWVGFPPPRRRPPRISMSPAPPRTTAADHCVCSPLRGLPSRPAPHAGGPRKPSPGPGEPLGDHGFLAPSDPGPPCKRTRRMVLRLAPSCLFIFLPGDPAGLPRTGRAEKVPGRPLCLVFGTASPCRVAVTLETPRSPSAQLSYCKWLSRQGRLVGLARGGVTPPLVLSSAQPLFWPVALSREQRAAGASCFTAWLQREAQERKRRELGFLAREPQPPLSRVALSCRLGPVMFET